MASPRVDTYVTAFSHNTIVYVKRARVSGARRHKPDHRTRSDGCVGGPERGRQEHDIRFAVAFLRSGSRTGTIDPISMAGPSPHPTFPFPYTRRFQIYLDSIKLTSLNVHWLRDQIGVVSQEPVLFGVSIADNIRYGRDGITDEDLMVAAVQANAHYFIKQLPNVISQLT